jgi:4-diphosphocytidyl-2-C-methyl-D-erythritol kinase
MEFFLHKRIPLGAGLGGGSSDASFAMLLANEMFGLGMEKEEMEKRISKYGADCAFFIRNTPSLAQGIGDVLSSVSVSLKDKCLLIVKPATFISTKEAYSGVTPHMPPIRIPDIVTKDLREWKTLLHNDFEASVFISHPEIASIKETLYDMGAIYASMSGSGSSLFGIFDKGILNVGGYKDGLDASKIFTDCFVHQSLLIY